MLASKIAKICVTPNAKPKFCVTPNASQWNIGCIGSPSIGARVGHVHIILFVSILFAFGSQHKHGFQWNMGFTLILDICSCINAQCVINTFLT